MWPSVRNARSGTSTSRRRTACTTALRAVAISRVSCWSSVNRNQWIRVLTITDRSIPNEGRFATRPTIPMGYIPLLPFMEVETGRYSSETQAIKAMLTQVQTWGRTHGVWVVIVAHPRKLMKLWGSNESEDIDMYTIAGSANWANLADFILSITRVDEEEKRYTRLDMLKVRDQDLCQKGSVIYVRQPCGRYDERESVEQVTAEMQGRVLTKDTLPWISF